MVSTKAGELFLLFNLYLIGVSKIKVPDFQRECLPEDLFEFYGHCSKRANEVSIIRLEYRKTVHLQTRDLVDLFFRCKYSFRYKRYLTHLKNIEDLGNVTKIKRPDKLPVVETNGTTEIKPELQNFETNMIQIIFAKDPMMVYNFVKSARTIIPFQIVRSLTILMFSSNSTGLNDVQEILMYLWNTYGLLNVIALIPCSTKYRNFYITYKPFRPTAFEYGQMQIQHLKSLRSANLPATINRRIPDLNGYTLKVSFFERYPTAFTTRPAFFSNSKIYSRFSHILGVEGITIQYLSQIMNFTIEVCADVECQYFGLVLDNNTAVGTLGQVIQRKVDIQGNARFIMDYGTEDFEFTTSYMHDKLCVVVPKAKLIPTWIKILRIFNLDTRVAFFVTFMAAAIASKLTKITMSVVDTMFQIYIIMIQQPTTMEVRNHGFARRILIGSIFVFCMIMSNIFVSALFTVFGVKTYYPDMKTLAEVDASGLAMKTSFDPFKGSSLTLYKKLSEKLSVDLKANDTIRFALNGSGASVERVEDTKFRMTSEFAANDGTALLHIVPDCPKEFYLAYIVPKGSPYLPAINQILTRFLESGLTHKWHLDVVDAIRLNSRPQSHVNQQERKSLSLNDVQPISWILIWGLSLSLIAFLVEICINKVSSAYFH